MTDNDKKNLINLCEKGCTDSDIEDYCDNHNIKWREGFHFIHVYFAPEQCKGCKHVDSLTSMYPCNSCSRICIDRYEKEVDAEVGSCLNVVPLNEGGSAPC